MCKFIKFGTGANERRVNKQDVVSIQRNSPSTVEITYRTVDCIGENPYALIKTQTRMTELEYQKLINIIDND